MSKNEINIGPQKGPQTAFLSTSADIALYGGAAGGGKTYAILLDFLRHFHNENAGAVYFRRTYPQIRNEGGLWDTAGELFTKVGARPRGDEFLFPKGPKIKFSHLQHEKNIFDWQGSQIPVIYFDELTHFTEKQFFYLMTRNRSTCGIKPYMRATTNPDVDSWVRKIIDWWIDENGFPIQERSGVIRWFVRAEDKIQWADSKEELDQLYPGLVPKSFTFIPSKLEDNKILMEKDPSYLGNLLAQDKVERERLLGGNWNVRPQSGLYFKKYYFEEVEAHPKLTEVVRCWDRAATEHKDGDSGDPDYTVGLKLGKDSNGIYYLIDIIRVRHSAHKIEQIIRNTAEQDGPQVKVKGFQDPGGAGKNEIEHFVRMLAGFQVVTEKISVDKVTAARAVSAQAEAGNIKILRDCNNKEDFYIEAENFPDGSHDDIIDALSGAFNLLSFGSVGNWTQSMSEYSEDSTLIDNDLNW